MNSFHDPPHVLIMTSERGSQSIKLTLSCKWVNARSCWRFLKLLSRYAYNCKQAICLCQEQQLTMNPRRNLNQLQFYPMLKCIRGSSLLPTTTRHIRTVFKPDTSLRSYLVRPKDTLQVLLVTNFISKWVLMNFDGTKKKLLKGSCDLWEWNKNSRANVPTIKKHNSWSVT